MNLFENGNATDLADLPDLLPIFMFTRLILVNFNKKKTPNSMF